MQKYTPFKVEDNSAYKAMYKIEDKIFVTEINPSKEDTDTLTIYESIEEFERQTGLKMEEKIINKNSLTDELLETTTDYELLDLTCDDYNAIMINTEGIYNRDDNKLTINKTLLLLGYEYNVEILKWIRSV